jgi:hypothetical protein
MITILAAGVFLAGCSSPKAAAPATSNPQPSGIAGVVERLKPCPSEASDAVLHKLAPKIIETYGNKSEELFARAEERIACLRDWAAASVKDRCQREQYEKWLDYFTGQIERRREQAKQNGDPEHEEYERPLLEREAKVRAYVAANPVPAPPDVSKMVCPRPKPE